MMFPSPLVRTRAARLADYSRHGLAMVLAAALTACAAKVQASEALRPPAVPLVTCNPYLSIWSRSDRLTDVPTTHWTHREHSLVSLIRVDGKAYRLMGTEPKDVPAMTQVLARVSPTRTIYIFRGGGVMVALSFLTPALPDDLEGLFSTGNLSDLERAVRGWRIAPGVTLRQHEFGAGGEYLG